MKSLQGIAASEGIAIAKAYKLIHPDLTVTQFTVENVEAEQTRLQNAIAKTEADLQRIALLTKEKLGEEEAAIFEAHLHVASDPEFISPILKKIKDERVNAEFALSEITTMFVSLFESMDDEYMRERAADIKDVSNRLLSYLLGVTIPNPSDIQERVIIIANDLTPSDTAQLNRQYVQGFITDIGGRTSHSAIMARTMEIPAIVGTKDATLIIEHNDLIIIDGSSGKVIINPDEQSIALYEQKIQQLAKQKEEWLKLLDMPTVTKDGHRVELAANIGTPGDLSAVLKQGAEGIGLFRTEFLYMGRETLPTEDEQFEAYKAVLQGMNGKPVVVRTLDIGGDKNLPYLALPEELNPFLGHRAIRLCLDRQDIFKTQLRALLRASTFGNLKIMFPMIATLQEFRQAKKLLLQEKAQLASEGVSINEKIEIGIMVEIPSVAIMANVFAKEVDFFSIGTNDLIQYTMAADRMNEKVSYLYQPLHPAILRLIKMVIDAAHKEGKWVGMCGEMAGDIHAAPVLLGLGLDEFSMSASSILKMRSLLSQMSHEALSQFAVELQDAATHVEVAERVEQLLKSN